MFFFCGSCSPPILLEVFFLNLSFHYTQLFRAFKNIPVYLFYVNLLAYIFDSALNLLETASTKYLDHSINVSSYLPWNLLSLLCSITNSLNLRLTTISWQSLLKASLLAFSNPSYILRRHSELRRGLMLYQVLRHFGQLGTFSGVYIMG